MTPITKTLIKHRTSIITYKSIITHYEYNKLCILSSLPTLLKYYTGQERRWYYRLDVNTFQARLFDRKRKRNVNNVTYL